MEVGGDYQSLVCRVQQIRLEVCLYPFSAHLCSKGHLLKSISFSLPEVICLTLGTGSASVQNRPEAQEGSCPRDNAQAMMESWWKKYPSSLRRGRDNSEAVLLMSVSEFPSYLQ